MARAPRDASWIKSPLANVRRARESASDVRTFASDENFFNFFHNFYLGMYYR